MNWTMVLQGPVFVTCTDEVGNVATQTGSNTGLGILPTIIKSGLKFHRILAKNHKKIAKVHIGSKGFCLVTNYICLLKLKKLKN